MNNGRRQLLFTSGALLGLTALGIASEPGGARSRSSVDSERPWAFHPHGKVDVPAQNLRIA